MKKRTFTVNLPITAEGDTPQEALRWVLSLLQDNIDRPERLFFTLQEYEGLAKVGDLFILAGSDALEAPSFENGGLGEGL